MLVPSLTIIGGDLGHSHGDALLQVNGSDEIFVASERHLDLREGRFDRCHVRTVGWSGDQLVTGRCQSVDSYIVGEMSGQVVTEYCSWGAIESRNEVLGNEKRKYVRVRIVWVYPEGYHPDVDVDGQ